MVKNKVFKDRARSGRWERPRETFMPLSRPWKKQIMDVSSRHFSGTAPGDEQSMAVERELLLKIHITKISCH
jgi:hypothetical protein